MSCIHFSLCVLNESLLSLTRTRRMREKGEEQVDHCSNSRRLNDFGK